MRARMEERRNPTGDARCLPDPRPRPHDNTRSTRPGSTSSQWFMSCKIRAVVTGDEFQVVAEVLAAGIELFEIAETAGHRFPAHVDDLGVRQHQVKETDVAEIVGHLVDEKPRGRLLHPVALGLAQVALAEFEEVLRLKVAQRAGILWFTRARSPAVIPGRCAECRAAPEWLRLPSAKPGSAR